MRQKRQLSICTVCHCPSQQAEAAERPAFYPEHVSLFIDVHLWQPAGEMKG